MKRFVYTLLVVCGTLSGFAQAKHELTVKVTYIDNSKGHMMVGIYNQAREAFNPKMQYAGEIKASQKGTMTFQFELPPGEYAVGVIHDENSNGELDKNLFGTPKEKYGFSGKATRPIFKDAAFLLSEKMEITIQL